MRSHCAIYWDILYQPDFPKRPYLLVYKNNFRGQEQSIAFPTRKQALTYAREKLHEYESIACMMEAVTLKKRKARKPSDPKIHHLVYIYLKSVTNSSTRKGVIYHSRSFLDLYGDMYAADLKKPHIFTFMEGQKQANVCLNTIHRRLTIMKSVFRYAKNWGYIKINPFDQMKLPNAPARIPNPPTVEELAKIYKYAAPHVRRTIVLGISTGARVGPCELFRLQWKHILFDSMIIRLPNAKKGAIKEFRDIPLTEDLKKVLTTWFEKDGYDLEQYIVHYGGKKVSRISQAWHRAIEKAHLTRRIRPYDLRHAFATMLMDSGADIRCVMDLMGHANERMLLTYYSHSTSEQRSKAILSIPLLPIFQHTSRKGKKRCQ